MSYVLVKDGVVESVILWDGQTEYEPPAGYALYDVDDEVAVGWQVIGNEWIPPLREEIEPPPELVAVEEAKQAALLELTALGVSEATARTIVGLPPLDI